MMSFCDGCQIERDFSDIRKWVIPENEKKLFRFCRFCTEVRAYLPDVYFDGKPEENLANGPDGKPITFSSKGEKAAYLESKGLREAGDRYHGAPISSVESEARRLEMVKVNNRKEIKEALEKVKRMPANQRREEYLRLINTDRR